LIMPDRDALGEMPLGAFSPQTFIQPEVNGVPQEYFSDPFPTGLNAIAGKNNGRYTNLGDAVTFDQNYQRTPMADRLSLSVQRELPYRFVLDATGMVNYISHDQWTEQINMMDPNLTLQYGDLSKISVANPLYKWPQDGNPCPGIVCRATTVRL